MLKLIQRRLNVVKGACETVAEKAQTLAVAAITGMGAMLGMSNDAAAALPAVVGTSIAAIQADGEDIFDLVFPVVAIFLGFAIVIKLFKRFSNKV